MLSAVHHLPLHISPFFPLSLCPIPPSSGTQAQMSRCIISGWPALMFCISVCVFFLLSSFGNRNNVGGGGEGRDRLARKRKGIVLVKIISEFQQMR